MSAWLVCADAGCTAGFLAGLLGIGGGLVVVPALVGARCQIHVPVPMLKRVFAGALVILAFRLAV